MTPAPWMPPVKDGVSTYYLSIGRNKRSVVLDFRDPRRPLPAGLLLRLADIAIENFKPGCPPEVRARLRDRGRAQPPAHLPVDHAGSERRRGRGPGRPDGPGRLRADEPDGRLRRAAFRAGISVFDVMAGLHGLIGILAALHQRHDGPRQHVEVNLLSSAMSGLVNQTAAYTAGGVVPQRMGNAHPSLFPYETMPTADRDMIITAGNDRQFLRLRGARDPEVPDDPSSRPTPIRTRNCERRAHRRRARQVEGRPVRGLNKAGVPCGPINTIGEGVELAESLGLAPRGRARHR